MLRNELAAALAGHGRLVLIGGEAGIGKTALARSLASDAIGQGAYVLPGHCYDLSNAPPYGPWRDLFAVYTAGPALPAAPAAFAGGRLERVDDRAALFAEVRRFLADLATARPTAIVLEDLHWADSASVELLASLAPHVRQWPLLVLATYRADELTRHHPFALLLPVLARAADGSRVDLRRLDVDALRALVAARYDLAEPDTARLVAYLDQHAEGNPFFASEVLRALEEEGLLRSTDGGWSLGELDRVVVPSLLHQVIDGRIARLGEETRQPLAIASIIGHEVPLDLWADLANLDEEALLAIVERAVETHLVEAARDGTRVRFVHALTRAALYEGIFPPRRRLWHRQVAERLAKDSDHDPDAVALHFQQAGDFRAAEWLERAGERALSAYAWLTASERVRAAADLLRGVTGQEEARRRLIFRIAYLLRFSYPAVAFDALHQAEELAVGSGDAVMVGETQYIAGILLCYSDRFRAGLAEMEKGLAAMEAQPFAIVRAENARRGWFADAVPKRTQDEMAEDELVDARLHAAGFHYRRCAHPWFLASSGQLDTATTLGERFAAALVGAPGTRGGTRVAFGFINHGLATAYAALGRPDDARREWSVVRQNFSEVEHYILVAFALLAETRDVAFTFGAADPAARRRLAAAAAAALGRAGGALRPGVSPRLAWLGCLVLDGRWDEARRILRDLPEPGNTFYRREVTASAVFLARNRGEPETAWEHIRALLPAGPPTDPGDIIHQEGLFLQRLATDLCLDRGDLVTARAWLDAHDRWLVWGGSVLGQAEGQLAWARWYHAAGDPDQARAHTTAALSLATSPDQPLVRLAAHRLLGELATANDRAVAESHLTTALDLAALCEAPFERALTLLSFARLRIATGATGPATVLLAEVRAICLPLGALPTLARADALTARPTAKQPPRTNPAGLTPRELEVLRLLLDHKMDKEIAEDLFLSLRTVEGHVANILTKLGVATRRDVAAAAARLGLV